MKADTSNHMTDRRELALLELLRRIVCAADRAALSEFHENRTPFRHKGTGPLRFTELIERLRADSAGGTSGAGWRDVADRAYDLTIDKFTHLPSSPAGPQTGTGGPDCRRYFGSVLSSVNDWQHWHPDAKDLDVEVFVALTLQKRVVSHFHLACLEAARSMNAARSRYAWRVGDGAFYVWLPAWLRGPRRRKWLEANVQDVDPSREGEQRRIQAIVDERLGVPHNVRLEAGSVLTAPHAAADSPLARLLQHDVGVHGLANVVAEEKVRSLDHQRPAVRALGGPTLRRLIHRIFEDLSQQSFSDSEIADAFGLSRATFSRFAGSRWRNRTDAPIPALWQNTAQVLARHPDFVEIAQDSGVWPSVQRVLLATRQETAS